MGGEAAAMQFATLSPPRSSVGDLDTDPADVGEARPAVIAGPLGLNYDPGLATVT
jgi:hypothetical protein